MPALPAVENGRTPSHRRIGRWIRNRSQHPAPAPHPLPESPGPEDHGPEDHGELEAVRSRLLASAVKALDDRDDAEDACQEALLRTWAAVQSGRCSYGRLEPFAFGTLRNVVREMRRGRCRDVPWNGSEPEDPTPDAAAGLVHEELRETVRIALDDLPEDHREVAVLTLAEDVSCSEFARSRGIAPATIRQRKRRARSRLAELFQVMGLV